MKDRRYQTGLYMLDSKVDRPVYLWGAQHHEQISGISIRTSHGDEDRVYCGLPVAPEFKKAGDDVRVVFEGIGVEALAGAAYAKDKHHSLLVDLGGSVDGACGFCSVAHKVKNQIVDAAFALLTDNDGEVSFRRYVNEGYTILNSSKKVP
jgi:hypothetical protein